MFWLSKDVIVKYLGRKSGIKGILISFLVGSISAGPIYAAFPVCSVLYKKGAKLSNIAIILSSWAVIKLPMLFVESKFLGLKFTLIRYFLTIPAILIIAFVMEKTIGGKKNKENENATTEILDKLPGLNCKACGYTSCYDFSKNVIAKKVIITKCSHIEN